MIQQSGLFPHRTVEDNIAVVPRMLKWKKERIQERIIQFVTKNSAVRRDTFTKMMLQTGELAADIGSVIYGEQAVAIGLIDRIGGLSDALECLHQMMDEARQRKNALRESQS